jgi:hypothetical protein
VLPKRVAPDLRAGQTLNLDLPGIGVGRDGDTLAGAVGWLVGAGMGLIFVASGLIGGAIAPCAYLVPAIRKVERELPDHS